MHREILAQVTSRFKTYDAAAADAAVESVGVTCHCSLTSVLVLWALPQCSSCSSSSV